MRRYLTFVSLAAALQLISAANAAPVMPAPGPGEQIVYQTVQPADGQAPALDAQWHTFITQVSGNASQNSGDEMRLGASTTARQLTHIAVSTQTFSSGSTPAYTPAFLELRVWLNTGPPSADGSAPDGQPTPAALPFAVSRVPGPSYPAGGNHSAEGLIVDFPFSALSVYNYTGASGGDAPFSNSLLLPEQFTVTIVNLDSAGVQDGSNPNGNAWGPYLSTGSTSNVTPGAGGPDYNNTTFNTNTVGASRTGAGPYTLTYTGHWRWSQSNGSAPGTGWSNGRSLNTVMDMTIYAVVPEPATIVLAAIGLCGLVAAARRSRRGGA